MRETAGQPYSKGLLSKNLVKCGKSGTLLSIQTVAAMDYGRLKKFTNVNL